MNANDAFTRAALYQSCKQSEILQQIDIENASSETLRDLLNKCNMLNIRKLPIIVVKFATKAALEFACNSFPKIKQYVDPTNIAITVEDDEALHLMNTASTFKPNLVFIVCKNIVLGALGSSITAFKSTLMGGNKSQAPASSSSSPLQKIKVAATEVFPPIPQSIPQDYTDKFSPVPSVVLTGGAKRDTDDSVHSNDSIGKNSLKSLLSHDSTVDSFRKKLIDEQIASRTSSRASIIDDFRVSKNKLIDQMLNDSGVADTPNELFEQSLDFTTRDCGNGEDDNKNEQPSINSKSIKILEDRLIKLAETTKTHDDRDDDITIIDDDDYDDIGSNDEDLNHDNNDDDDDDVDVEMHTDQLEVSKLKADAANFIDLVESVAPTLVPQLTSTEDVTTSDTEQQNPKPVSQSIISPQVHRYEYIDDDD